MRNFAIAVLALLAAACGKNAEATALAAPPPPKVTVALPVTAQVADYSDHTGHTEAPEAVAIRPRASGHLDRVAFKEGDLVKKGDLLFVIDPRPYQATLTRARAELGTVRADLDLATKNTKRADDLLKMGAIAAQEADGQRAQLAQLEARQASAQAAISSAALDLEYAYVRSPISGRIGRALITTGNLVGPENVLATVVSVDPLYVYIDVDEVHGLRLRSEAKSIVRVGFPGEEGYPHEAPIDWVDNRVDPTTATMKARVVISNKEGKFAHGLFARVRLTDGEAHDALLVADKAIATDQDRRFVWVIGEDGKAVYRGVKLGALEGNLRVVREGLTGKDRVVVRGLQRVRPGAPVTPELVPMKDVDGQLAVGERTP